MNEKITIPSITLKPFTRFCMTIGELPSSYLESMTYYEQLLWFTKYLKDTVIPAINNNANAVTEVQNIVMELQDYINNYFDNLDVQEEINNKLDDMAESGELTEIIAQYLQLAGVLAYDTLSDLVSAENIVNGSIAKTLGKLTYNDGEGSFYKIRTITSSDVVDGDNIVALNVSNTLIAEKINDYNLDLLLHKKFIFIGDSYNTTDTPEGGTQIVPWASLVKNYLGLSDNQYYSSGVSGAGWSVENNKFITQLQAFENIITNKDEITDIYVLGGINDNQIEPATVYNDIISFSNYAKTNYPNAMVTIGIISWAEYTASKINLIKKMDYYLNSCIQTNIRFISEAYTWFHVYSGYQADGHPTASGSLRIAVNLANYIKGGITSNKVYYEGYIYRDNNTLGIPSSQPTVGTVKQFLNGETVNLIINIDMLTGLTNNSIAPSTSSMYVLGSIDNIFIRTLNEPLCIYHGHCWGYDNTLNKYIDMNYGLFIQEGQLKVKFYYVDKDSGNITLTCSVIVFDDIPIINIPVAFC